MRLVIRWGNGDCEHWYWFEGESIELARKELDYWRTQYRQEYKKVVGNESLNFEDIDVLVELPLFGISIGSPWDCWYIAYHK